MHNTVHTPTPEQDPLHQELVRAVRDNDPDAFRKALKAGADPNADYGPGYTFLQHFISNMDNDAVLLLISHGANPHPPKRAQRGLSPLETALIFRNELAAAYLLDAGADPNQIAMDNAPVLHFCANNDYAQGIKLLISRGANVHSFDPRTGFSALHKAACLENPDSGCVAELLAGGADPNALHIGMPHPNALHIGMPHPSALSRACQTGNAERIRLLLDAGANPNGNGIEPDPPLFSLLRSERFSLHAAKALLDAGLDPRLPNPQGLTALCATVYNFPSETPEHNAAADHEALLGLLIEHGADPEEPDISGQTPLAKALYHAKPAAIRFLMRIGCACELNPDDESLWQFDPKDQAKATLISEMAIREAKQLSEQTKAAPRSNQKPAL